MAVKEKVAAVITVKDSDKMSARCRKQIANWLRSQADHLERDGKQYAKQFRARYMYI